jgi:hypothetical protein
VAFAAGAEWMRTQALQTANRMDDTLCFFLKKLMAKMLFIFFDQKLMAKTSSIFV